MERWWIEREHGERIEGPFTTRDDALRARTWVEKVYTPETFWVRTEPANHTVTYPTGPIDPEDVFI